MGFEIFRKWLKKRRSKKYSETNEQTQITGKDGARQAFSPITYYNPYIRYMHKIIEHLIKQRGIAYQKLELIVIDAGQDRDQDELDIWTVLDEIAYKLNYLLVVTDTPDRYEAFNDEMYEENGLIVQCVPKSAHSKARGNLVLDFEREGGIFEENSIFSKNEAIYLPIYKRPWEISENLDILVPVGYNTLVVDGILPADFLECSSINDRFRKDKMTDRLDREFRKG